jgi:parallel beta-helix repeat protein
VANRYGGAVVVILGSTPTIRYNSLTGNRAVRNGGAMFINSDSRPRVEKNNISYNRSGGFGGAIVIYRDNVSQVLDNYIGYNQSGADWGGGISIENSSAEVKGNQIVFNRTQGNGGGLVAVGEGNPQILNNLIASNHAGGQGDGAYILASVLFRGNTVANNDRNQNGDGIFIAMTPSARLVNNLVIGNDYGIRSTGPQPGQMSRNCFYDNRLDNYNGVTRGPDDFSTNPMLVNGPLGSYYLAQSTSGQANTSPLVNAANQTAQELGLSNQTTRTDGQTDQGMADIGFHFGRALGRNRYLPMVALSN